MHSLYIGIDRELFEVHIHVRTYVYCRQNMACVYIHYISKRRKREGYMYVHVCSIIIIIISKEEMKHFLL